jgi:hypothetical protein
MGVHEHVALEGDAGVELARPSHTTVKARQPPLNEYDVLDGLSPTWAWWRAAGASS